MLLWLFSWMFRLKHRRTDLQMRLQVGIHLNLNTNGLDTCKIKRNFSTCLKVYKKIHKLLLSYSSLQYSTCIRLVSLFLSFHIGIIATSSQRTPCTLLFQCYKDYVLCAANISMIVHWSNGKIQSVWSTPIVVLSQAETQDWDACHGANISDILFWNFPRATTQHQLSTIHWPGLDNVCLSSMWL